MLCRGDMEGDDDRMCAAMEVGPGDGVRRPNSGAMIRDGLRGPPLALELRRSGSCAAIELRRLPRRPKTFTSDPDCETGRPGSDDMLRLRWARRSTSRSSGSRSVSSGSTTLSLGMVLVVDPIDDRFFSA